MGKQRLFLRGVGVLLAGASVFVLLSLASFDLKDVGEFSLPPNNPVGNDCGIAGAHLAQFLFRWFGVSAFLMASISLALGTVTSVRPGVRDVWMKLVGLLLLTLSLSCVIGLFPANVTWLPSDYGGYVGIFCYEEVAGYFGKVGTILIGVVLGALSAMLLSVDQVVVSSARSTWAALGQWRGRARARAIVRAKEAELRQKEEPSAKADVRKARKAPPRRKAVAKKKETKKRDERVAAEETVKKVKVAEKVAESVSHRQATDAAAGDEEYQLPPIEILDEPEAAVTDKEEAKGEAVVTALEATLTDFGIGAHVVNIDRGPVVTRYELELAAGIKVHRITGLSDNIAMAIRAPTVRIVAPIPGKSTVGVEVPNEKKELVRLKELIESKEYAGGSYELPLFLGKDSSGGPVVADLTQMPHLLIAGATGSGKSVCLNAMILSLLTTKYPDDVRLILVDPKMVELAAYQDIPHLLSPVVTDMKRAPWVLDWAVQRMDERYDLLARAGVRHIRQYNDLGEERVKARLGVTDDEADPSTLHLPYVVIIIDELADLMMVASKEVEISITRLAQKSRAVGIHIIVATQRPSVDVITGLIKSNLPTRISFQVTSKVDSRTILDQNGADKLLGSGDMLFMPPGTAELIRVQGTYVNQEEIDSMADCIREEGEPEFLLDLAQLGNEEAPAEEESGQKDELYDQAVRIVLETQRGSVSLLQRRLEIGYTRASRLIDAMSAEGLVGGFKGSKAREVLFTLEEWEGEQPGADADFEANEEDARLEE